MKKFRKILIKLEESEGGWRVYWSDTQTLADPRCFGSIEEAGGAVRGLLTPAPKLKLIQKPEGRSWRS